MYSINNIPLASFGITPAQISGSNIALAGHLDLAPRIGKTYHDWTGEAGVEPYVTEAEIFRGGRTLGFAGYMVGDGRAAAEGQLAEFYALITGFEDLVPFATPWGTYQVYVKEAIESVYLQQGYIKFTMQLQEPQPAIEEFLYAEGTNTGRRMDGTSFDEIGMFLTGFNGGLNRAQSKRQQFSAYGKEGFQITPIEALTLEAILVAVADDYEQLKKNVGDLRLVTGRPLMRTCYFDDNPRECFNVDGLQVQRIIVAGNYAACQITLPMVQPRPGAALNTAFLADNAYSKMITDQEQYLTVYA